jgi:hypothetical protein
MGFFSWKTTDTKRSICNAFSGKRTFTVYMTSSDGTTYIEDKYQGYGEFDGKDFHVLLAEMNKDIINNVDGKELRDKGIELYFGDYKNVKFPLLTENKPKEYKNIKPKDCKYQGYFYNW